MRLVLAVWQRIWYAGNIRPLGFQSLYRTALKQEKERRVLHTLYIPPLIARFILEPPFSRLSGAFFSRGSLFTPSNFMTSKNAVIYSSPLVWDIGIMPITIMTNYESNIWFFFGFLFPTGLLSFPCFLILFSLDINPVPE